MASLCDPQSVFCDRKNGRTGHLAFVPLQTTNENALAATHVEEAFTFCCDFQVIPRLGKHPVVFLIVHCFPRHTSHALSLL